MHVDLVSDGVKVQYVPDDTVLQECFELGVTVGSELKKRIAENK
jgi:hypothetical protein